MSIVEPMSSKVWRCLRWALPLTMAAFVMWALTGCGGDLREGDAAIDRVPDDEQIEPEAVPEPDLAFAEFAIQTKPLYGWNSAYASGGNIACDQSNGNDTNVCIYPENRTRRICVSGIGMTAGQKTEAEADVDAILPTLNSQFSSSNWLFSRGCGTGDTASLEYGNIPDSQQLASILGYVRVSSSGSSLDEALPYKGTHKKQSGTATIRVDRAQIVNDFSVNDQPRVRRHALYGGMYAALAGLGFTRVHTNRVTSVAITSAVAKTVSVSAQEQCRVNAYDPFLNNPIIGVDLDHPC